ATTTRRASPAGALGTSSRTGRTMSSAVAASVAASLFSLTTASLLGGRRRPLDGPDSPTGRGNRLTPDPVWVRIPLGAPALRYRQVTESASWRGLAAVALAPVRQILAPRHFEVHRGGCMTGASSGAAMPGQRPAPLGLDVVKPTTDDGPCRPLISRWVIRISWRPEA